MRLSGATASAVGNVREANEDLAWFGDPLAVLADGMGGHHGGALAAQLAVGQFEAALSELRSASPRAHISDHDMADLVQVANRSVHDHAADNGLPGMGTTLVTLTLQEGPRVLIANVGDSRAYRVAPDELVQITSDHSFVEDLVRQGRLTKEEAAVHPQRNIVTRAIGIGQEVEVDLFALEDVEVGDRYLLCSDGLFNEVSEAEILSILQAIDEPNLAAEALVETALETPCRDNVTVVVVDVVTDDAQSADATTALGISGPETTGAAGARPVKGPLGHDVVVPGAVLMDPAPAEPLQDDGERFRTTADYLVDEADSASGADEAIGSDHADNMDEATPELSSGRLKLVLGLVVVPFLLVVGAVGALLFVSPAYLLKELDDQPNVYAVFRGLPVETVAALDLQTSGEDLADEVDLSLVNADVAEQCGERFSSIDDLGACVLEHTADLQTQLDDGLDTTDPNSPDRSSTGTSESSQSPEPEPVSSSQTLLDG